MGKIKSSPLGGRPRKDGSPARIRLRDPITNRFIKDTPANRERLGLPPAAEAPSVPPSKRDTGPSEGKTATPATSASTSLGKGPEAAREAVREGKTAAVPTEKAAPAAEAAEVNYLQVVQIVNMIVKARVPEAQMRPDEIEQIGKGLDAVIAKHWPDLKTAGPEFALTVAIVGYLARLFSESIGKRPKLTPSKEAGEASKTAAGLTAAEVNRPTGPAEIANPVGDPYAGTGAK